jgi:hypothetical protein
MNMNSEALIAIASLATAVVAIIALIIESRRHRFAVGLDLILRLDTEFRSYRMIRQRKRAAEALQKKDFSKAYNHIDQVINFFEEVAFLLERKAIDAHIVWTHFFYYLNRLWYFIHEYVRSEQGRDPGLWTGVTEMYSRLEEIERKDRRKRGGAACPSAEELQAFLQEEADLAINEEDVKHPDGGYNLPADGDV